MQSPADTNSQLHVLLEEVHALAPRASLSDLDSVHPIFHLGTRDALLVAKILHLVDDAKIRLGIASYDVFGTSIENIFLELMSEEEQANNLEIELNPKSSTILDGPIRLFDGRQRSAWSQASTIFHKRALIARRSWLVILLALAVGISGAWWPIRFLHGKTISCARHAPEDTFSYPIFPVNLYYSQASILLSPPDLLAVINVTSPSPALIPFNEEPNEPYQTVADNKTFVDFIQQRDYGSFDFSITGGISLDLASGNSVIYWQYGQFSPDLFSLVSNVHYNRALNTSLGAQPVSRHISPSYGSLPSVDSENLLSLQWVAIFGAAMVAFPAFFVLYVAKERHSSVQAMQLSNGLTDPLGLWLGHLMFDSLLTVIMATVVTIVFGVLRDKFQGLGYLWFVLVLYGIGGTLLSYLFAHFVKSPIAAFIAVAAYQFIVFILYLTAYIVTFFTAIPQHVPRILSIVNFTLSLFAPITSLTRAALVSINLFSLLCDDEHFDALGSITRYGGPILYLIMWIVFLIMILARIESRSTKSFSGLSKTRKRIIAREVSLDSKDTTPDVVAEAKYSASSHDIVRVLHVDKSYDGKNVVEDVSLSIPRNSIFTLLGPNGAGKTTTFDIIRGTIKPEFGEVFVNGTSVLHDTKKTRQSLGVCPQFTAIDSQLSVREHLLIYGRLKGLNRGEELQSSVDSILSATGLHLYSNRLANKLSGGNQRKLSLAIALIGNPPVILVDEFSTGVDAKMKRELWAMLKHLSADKAVLLTTHSMEEAAALSSKVGIMSKRMLAVGSVDELAARYALYEVHFSCRDQTDLPKIQLAMAKIPGSKMTDSVATRFEVPIRPENGLSLADLFQILAVQEDFPEFTVAKSTLETAFIGVINSGGIEEEGARERHRWWIL